jgi:hypothetical protein
MVSIVETDCTRKAFYMGFQHIKVLADKVLREAELAARGHDGAHKFNGSGDEPVTQGGGPSPSPIAAAVGGDPVREWNEVPEFFAPYSGERGKGPSEQAPGSEWNEVARKEASAETPASASREEVRVETVRRPVLDTPPTIGRWERIAMPQRPSPVAAMRCHLLMVWNDVQADTTFRAGAL